MPKYRVNLVAIAEAFVDVWATDEDNALEIAFENAPQGANISNDFDMTEWRLPTDVWPRGTASVTDIEELEED